MLIVFRFAHIFESTRVSFGDLGAVGVLVQRAGLRLFENSNRAGKTPARSETKCQVQILKKEKMMMKKR